MQTHSNLEVGTLWVCSEEVEGSGRKGNPVNLVAKSANWKVYYSIAFRCNDLDVCRLNRAPRPGPVFGSVQALFLPNDPARQNK